METALQVFQTLGFPTACVLLLGYVGYKFLNRIMDENKNRESRYVDILETYSDRMNDIAQTLKEIQETLQKE